MRAQLIIILVLIFNLPSISQIKSIDRSSKVTFKIKNAGITVDGTINGLSGHIQFSPANLSKSTVTIELNANTINTGNDTRDGHLRKKEYFNVLQFPKITFKSKSFEKTNSGFLCLGVLTLKGNSREVSIPFSYQKSENIENLSGEILLNRLDFNVGSSSWILSDEVWVSFQIKLN